MRDQGDQQFKAEHKKKPCISYFIHKSDVHYENKVYRSEGEYNDKSKKAYINAEVFDKIEFRFGLPLIVFDFIDYLVAQISRFWKPEVRKSGKQNCNAHSIRHLFDISLIHLEVLLCPSEIQVMCSGSLTNL